MRYAIEKLITVTKRDLDTIEDEINTLSCEINPHPDDVSLCKKLVIKSECYMKFHRKLTEIMNDEMSDL